MTADRQEPPPPLWASGTAVARRVEVLAERVGALVEATVTPVVQGPVGRFWARARYAQSVLRLSVQDPVGRFRLVVPDRADLDPRRLADATACVTALRSRFPWAAVQLAAFDDTSVIRGHPVSGVVMESKVLEIHVDRGLLTDAYATSTLLEVVVHECWHVIEDVFEASRYRDSLEFRNEVGRLLGLDTLGHAYGGPAASSARAAAARDLLTEAVGTYATTSPEEGTAELFTAWWLETRSHPVVEGFGALVDRYLPEGRGPGGLSARAGAG